MKDEFYNKKITVYISEKQAQKIKNLPRDFNLSGRMREALEDIVIKGGWEFRKRILTKKDISKYFLEVNSQGNNSGEIIWLRPIDKNQWMNIPAIEGYGIKLTLKDAKGNEIPDDAIIEFKKKKLDITMPLGDYFYKELKREVKPLRTQIELFYPEELVIGIEPKYAGIIYIPDIEFIFAIDFFVKRQESPWGSLY